MYGALTDAPKPSRAGSPGTLVRGAVAASLVFLFILWAQPWGASASVLLDDVVENIAVALACAACGVRAWRCQGRGRKAWSLLAVFNGLWFLGGMMWLSNDLAGGAMPFPSGADIAFLLAVPVAGLGLLALPSPDTSTTRLRKVVDGALVAASVLFIAWAFLIGPLVRNASTSLADVVALAYPFGDVVMLAIAITLVARAGRSRTTILLLAGGMAAIAISDSAFAWISLYRPAAAGDLMGAGWLFGFLLIGVAAATPTGEPDSASALSATKTGSPVVILGSVLVSLLGVTYLLATGRGLDVGLNWIQGAIGLLVVVRQWLTTIEVAHFQHELRELAFRDGLTGLANRSLLEATVERRLDRKLPVTMVLLDLDDFKTVNDTFGHRAGDRVLVEVARRIEGQVDADSLVARIGGDEFAVMLTTAVLSGEAEAVAERLQTVLAWPVRVEGVILPMSASIGVALPRRSAGSLGEVLREADLAMYQAKRAGGGAFVLYEAPSTTGHLVA